MSSKVYYIKTQSFIKMDHLYNKDVIMRRFKTSIDSEDFLQIDSQPGNTCPMINPVQQEIENSIKELEKIKEISIPSNYKYYDNCAFCSNSEVLNDNIKEATKVVDQASEWVEDLEKAKDYLEVLRKDCETMRDHGSIVKELLWSMSETELTQQKISEYRSDFNKLQESIPEQQYSHKTYKKYFPDESLANFELIQFSNCENENCPFSSSLLSEFESLNELLPTGYFLEEDISSAENNYESISSWVHSLLDKSFEILDNPQVVDEWREALEFDKFIAEYQEHFEENYKKYWSRYGDADLNKLEKHPENVVDHLELLTNNGYETEALLAKDLLSRVSFFAKQLKEVSVQESFSAHALLTEKAYAELHPKVEMLWDFARAIQIKDKNKYFDAFRSIISPLDYKAFMDKRHVFHKFSMESRES